MKSAIRNRQFVVTTPSTVVAFLSFPPEGVFTHGRRVEDVIDRIPGVIRSHAADFETVGQRSDTLPGLAGVGRESEQAAGLVPQRQKTFSRLAPIDGAEVEMAGLAGGPSFATVVSPGARAVDHEAHQPLARRIEIKGETRLATATDLLVV